MNLKSLIATFLLILSMQFSIIAASSEGGVSSSAGAGGKRKPTPEKKSFEELMGFDPVSIAQLQKELYDVFRGMPAEKQAYFERLSDYNPILYLTSFARMGASTTNLNRLKENIRTLYSRDTYFKKVLDSLILEYRTSRPVDMIEYLSLVGNYHANYNIIIELASMVKGLMAKAFPMSPPRNQV